MVADALQRAQRPDHAEHPGDGARVFHHVGGQFAQRGLVLAVDGLVVLGHRQRQLGIETREGVQRVAHHAPHLVADVAHLDIAARRRAFLAELDGPAGDLRGLVADALQVDHRLGDADHQTQVGGRRLATREDAQARLVDVALHLVGLLIDLAHLLGQARVGLDQRGDRVVDLLLHQAAHGQQVAAHLFQLGVELLGNVLGMAVFVDHVLTLANCFLSPDRPALGKSCCARRRRADSTNEYGKRRRQRAARFAMAG